MAKPKPKPKQNPLTKLARTIEGGVKAAISPIALIAPAASVVMAKGITPAAIAPIMQMYTGFNPESGKFVWQSLIKGWGPYVATKFIKKAIRYIGG